MRRGRASLLRDARDPRVDVALRRHLLTETFVELRREYPEVTCELFTGNADVVEERLERGLLDFALVIEPVNVEKYEWLRIPEHDRSGVVVAADSEWAALDAVTPEDLARMRGLGAGSLPPTSTWWDVLTLSATRR